MKKIRVCVLFGGKSGEHEVSLQSAKSIIENLDKNKYEVILIGIDKTGKWVLGNKANYLLNDSNPKLIALNKSNESPEVTAITTSSKPEIIEANSGKSVSQIDVFFPIIHGTYGEDGSLQGMLEMLDAAHVGAGVLGSAVGMDKDVMKRLLKGAGIPVARFYSLKKYEVNEKKLDEIASDLGLPVFVKPANLGSSVGVVKVGERGKLKKAIEESFQYDTKILIEEAIAGREIECSILGNDNPKASVVGEIIPQHEFYSYEAKYIDENGALLKIPAEIPGDIQKKIQELAIKAFKTLECNGFARVDCFLTKDNQILINEINTLPGFTKISMYPKLWEASGLSYSQLLDKLIELAIEKKKEKSALKRNYTA